MEAPGVEPGGVEHGSAGLSTVERGITGLARAGERGLGGLSGVERSSERSRVADLAVEALSQLDRGNLQRVREILVALAGAVVDRDTEGVA